MWRILHFIYKHECYGTKTNFVVNSFVVIKQNVKKLIASDNPAALAVLAAKYSIMSKGNDIKRRRLKKKVLDLTQQKGFSLEKLEEMINFVFDYMLLPPKMEEELKTETPFFQSKITNKMVMTPERLFYLDALYLNETGKTVIDNLIDKDAEVAAAKAEAVAAKEALEAAKEAAKEAIKEAAKEAKEATKLAHWQTVHNMLKEGFSIERIAHILDKDLSYISELANSKLA
jgi:SOS response regulatory protein OraA/RecX